MSAPLLFAPARVLAQADTTVTPAAALIDQARVPLHAGKLGSAVARLRQVTDTPARPAADRAQA